MCMIKKYLSMIFFLMISFFVYSQENKQVHYLRTEQNGIQVYESTGVERNTLTASVVERKVKTIADWSLDDCDNALYFLGLKIESVKQEAGNQEQLQLYLKEKERIEERKNELTSNTK